MSSNRNVNIFTCDTKITKLFLSFFFIECLYLVGSWNIWIIALQFLWCTILFNYYTYLDFRDISRFSHCTKLSQCREQEGSATLVIVTLHLLSTLPIYKINDIPLTIFLFATTLRYNVGLFCQGVLMFLTVKHLTLALLSPLLFTTVLTFRMTKERVEKENCAM